MEPQHIIGILSGGCCCFVVVAGIAFLAFKMLSGKKNEPPAARLTDRKSAPAPMPVTGAGPVAGRLAQYGNIVSRTTDDGFYFFNEMLTPGSLINYRYRNNSGWVSRSVPYQPGPQGHFVYLGGAPRDLEVIDVIPSQTPGDIGDNSAQTILAPGAGNQPRGLAETADDSSPGQLPAVPPSMVRTVGDYPTAY